MCAWPNHARDAADREPGREGVALTEEERRILHDGVCRQHRDTVPGVYVCKPCEYAGDEAVERILAARLAAQPVPAPGEGDTAVLELSSLIDGTYPGDLDPEAHRWRRCVKAGEEYGEVVEALLGLSGEDPRKGVTNGLAEVRK